MPAGPSEDHELSAACLTAQRAGDVLGAAFLFSHSLYFFSFLSPSSSSFPVLTSFWSTLVALSAVVTGSNLAGARAARTVERTVWTALPNLAADACRAATAPRRSCSR